MRLSGFFDAVVPDHERTTGKGSQELTRAHSEEDPRKGLRRPRLILTANWLNRVLADCCVLDALYRKHHRRLRSSMDPSLRVVLNGYADQQLVLIEELTTRIHVIGGVAAEDPRDIAELTCVPRAPDGTESERGAVSRLLQAQDITVRRARAGASVLGENGDESSSELLGSRVVSIVEEQLRELVELLGGIPLGEGAGER